MPISGGAVERCLGKTSPVGRDGRCNRGGRLFVVVGIHVSWLGTWLRW